MSTNQNTNEEEVDLGSLFKIIGKGFSNFFNFIGNVFKGIFHGVIVSLIFLKENIIKICIAAIIGGGIGFFLDIKKQNLFGSDLLVQPNFKSARQLYNNINYYNELVLQQDYESISKIFNLSNEDAANLKSFTIEPVINGNDIIQSYNDFILEVDTVTVKSYSFKDFKESFEELDYRVHKISVMSSKNNVFKNLGEVIISSIVKNKYLNRIKVLTNENLNRTDSIYRQNLSQIDSLRKVYIDVMKTEAKKETLGTNIDIGGEKRKTKEIELFETNRKINVALKKIVEEKSEKYEVINVISEFQPVGYEIKGISTSKVFQLSILGAFSVIFVLILMKINSFLGSYTK